MSILRNVRQKNKAQKKTFRKPFSFDEISEESQESTQETLKVENAPQKKPKPKKTKKGRPKLEKNMRRNKHITAVLTQDELKKLNKLVVKSRLSKSEYVRRLVLQAIDKNIYHL